jgi:Ca-activated chloride channel family protein
MRKFIVVSCLSLLLLSALIFFIACNKRPLLEITVEKPPGCLTLNLKQENEYALTNQSNKLYLEADILAQELTKESRQPINLALVIDRSGSMLAKGKLDYVKEAAGYLIDKLTERDTLSLVTYSSEVQVVFPQGKVKDKELLKDKLNFVSAQGWTFLSGGLEEGFNQLKSVKDEDSFNHIILLSDGMANRGVSDLLGLRQIAAGFYQQGVTLSTIGVGLDYDEDILRGLSEEATGNYYYIAVPEEIPDIYAGELDYLSNAVATQAGLLVRLQEGVKLTKVFGHQFTQIDEGLYHIGLGKLRSAEQQWVVLELEVPPHSETGKMEIGSVTLRYRDISRAQTGAEGQVELSQGVYLTYTQDSKQVEKGRNISVFNAVNFMVAQETKQQAQQLIKAGKLKEADKLLSSKCTEINNKYKLGGMDTPQSISDELGAMNSMSAELKSTRPSKDRLSEMRKEMDYDAYQKTKFKEDIK